MKKAIQYREVRESDRGWIEDLMTRSWASSFVVTRRNLFDTRKLPGIVAEVDGKPVGIVTYTINGQDCQLVTLNSMMEGKGIGTELIERVKKIARENGCHRVWLITTNDNTKALRFYQKRGLTIRALYPNAIEQSRKLKPQLPMTGLDGIPIRDEIELEIAV